MMEPLNCVVDPPLDRLQFGPARNSKPSIAPTPPKPPGFPGKVKINTPLLGGFGRRANPASIRN
jgi:hypothetical protein